MNINQQDNLHPSPSNSNSDSDYWINDEEFDTDLLPIDMFDDPDWEQIYHESQQTDEESFYFIKHRLSEDF